MIAFLVSLEWTNNGMSADLCTGMEKEHIHFLSLLLQFRLCHIKCPERNGLSGKTILRKCNRKQNHLGILVQESQFDRFLILALSSVNMLEARSNRFDILHESINVAFLRMPVNDILISGFLPFSPEIGHHHHRPIRLECSESLTICGLDIRIRFLHLLVLNGRD